MATNENTTAATTRGRFGILTLGLAVLALAVAPAAAAPLDGSVPFLCAINTIMECDATGECQRHTALQHPDFPPFLRIDVGLRLITDPGNADRKTEIKASSRLDGRLILQGGENGRGWSATIAEATGRLSAGVVGDDFTFALFGACTAP